MSEQEVSETFVVTLEGFGASFGRWETVEHEFIPGHLGPGTGHS